MDRTAMFSLTYGIFLAGAEAGGRKNACIINTAVQATSKPVCMHVTMLKTNLTTEMILKKGSLAVSVLSGDCPLPLIEGFGLYSGRESDKFAGVSHKTDGSGNPYIEQYSVAYISMKITSTIDLGTHYLFIGDVVEAEKTGGGKPMTYTDYRILKSGGTPDKGPDQLPQKRWVCSVCHYVYDGEIPFEDLPDTWLCPVCKQPKSVFVLLEQ